MVDVYRNLNKRGVVYSVRENGFVIGYCTHIILSNVTFRHPTPADLKKIRNGNRYVCAWMTGYMENYRSTVGEKMLCDPKIVDYFSDLDGRKIDYADLVFLSPTGVIFDVN